MSMPRIVVICHILFIDQSNEILFMVYHAQIAQVDVNQWGKFNPNEETILTWLPKSFLV